MSLTEKQLEAIAWGMARVPAPMRLALEGQPPELQHAQLKAFFGAEKRDAAAAKAAGITVEQYRYDRDQALRAKRREMAKRMSEARAAKEAEARETRKK